MQKSPAERMREQVLKSLGLTEEELDAMPPEKREQVEKGIGERMREMIAMQNGQRRDGKRTRRRPARR